MFAFGFSSWVTSVKMNLANMSPVNTDEIDRVPNNWMGLVRRTQRSVGEATSKLKGQGLRRHSLCPDTRPSILSEWHVQQCGFFLFYLTQTAQTMLPPRAICWAYGHPQVPHLSVRGNAAQTERVVWGETLNRSPRIIFCHIVWDMTDTRALINSG